MRSVHPEGPCASILGIVVEPGLTVDDIIPGKRCRNRPGAILLIPRFGLRDFSLGAVMARADLQSPLGSELRAARGRTGSDYRSSDVPRRAHFPGLPRGACFRRSRVQAEARRSVKPTPGEIPGPTDQVRPTTGVASGTRPGGERDPEVHRCSDRRERLTCQSIQRGELDPSPSQPT